MIKVGTWPASTGEWTVTPEDLQAAVAAVASPSVRRPVLKLGHTDTRFDGEPAVGWVDNMRVSSDGSTLLGDFKGVPAWLADVMASAYPDRSIEGAYKHRDQTGHVHDFALTAVALLGVESPAIGTLESLQDVARLYGVAAAEPTGKTVTITMTGAKTVSAAETDTGSTPEGTDDTAVGPDVSISDVQRSFYDEVAKDNWWWIEEIYLNPSEVIAADDEGEGKLWRVPFDIADGDVAWGTPQEVKREYVAASHRTSIKSWDSADLSRPRDIYPRAVKAAEAEGETAMAFTDDQLAQLREALGLAEDTTDEDFFTALLDKVTAPDESEAPADGEAPAAVAARLAKAGISTIEAAALADLKVRAARGDEAMTRLEDEDRARRVDARIADGAIHASRRDHWLKQLKADPGAAAVLDGLEANVIPVAEVGTSIAASEASADDALYAALFHGKEA
nr:hypothetical protein [Gordonia desulfuricans]